MATSVRTLQVGAPASGTSGSFREFVSFIRDAFEGSGFTNTFPSGNINTSSVNPPIAANREQGYDVFAFNDTFQATAPMFVRVGYRSAAGVGGNIFGVNIDIGEYHDTSGSVYSVFFSSGSNRLNISTNQNLTPNLAQSQSCLWSGAGGSRISVCMFPLVSGSNANFYSLVFTIERTRDWQGNFVPSGAVVTGFNKSNGSYMYLNGRDFGTSHTGSTGFVSPLSRVVGQRIVVQPIVLGKTAMEPPPLGMVLTIASESLLDYTSSINPTGSQHTLNFGNVTYNYVRLPNGMGGSSLLRDSTHAGPQLLMIWE
jgi:hypothetical protein